MKNKILPILCIFILISFTLVSNVFAYSEEFEYGSTTINTYIPDAVYNTLIELPYYNNTDYKFIAYCGDSRLNVYFFPKDMDIKIWKKTQDINDGAFYSNSNTISNFTCIHYWISENDGSIIKEDLNHTFFCTETSTLGYYIGSGNHYFITNMNIYTDSTCTDFFFKAPVTETTLAGVLEGVKPMETFQTMMSGIIPYLIAFLVGLVAFWKAWQLLLKELRKA